MQQKKLPLERRLSPELISAIKEQIEYYSKKRNDPDICWNNIGSVHCMHDGITIVKSFHHGVSKDEKRWYLVWEPYNPSRIRTHLDDVDLEWNFNYGDHWLKL